MKPVWIAEVHRTVKLLITAATEQEAAEQALDEAWEWQPEDADGGDQGSVSVSVTKVTDGDG
jgi:hypothetical protein